MNNRKGKTTMSTFDKMKANQLGFLQELLLNHSVAMKKEESSFTVKVLVEGKYEVEPNFKTGEWEVLEKRELLAKFKMVIPMDLVSEEGYEIFIKNVHITVASNLSDVRRFLIAIQKLPEGEWTVKEKNGEVVAVQKISLYKV